MSEPVEPAFEMCDVEVDEDSLIELSKIEKRFGAVTALAGVSVSVYAGECHCLLGDNGADKSTFIKTMSGAPSSPIWPAPGWPAP